MADALTTYALCWRIDRRDGVSLGLTDHDRDLVIAGLVYRAAPGITPSAIKRSDALEGDTMDVAGALTSAALAEADLLDGRWDGARVTLVALDWAAGGAPVPLGSGQLGAIETSDGRFTAELRGAAAALDRAVVELTSPACRAELGDIRCRVPLGARRRFARVMAADAQALTLDRAEPSVNAYGAGLLRWFGGANAGLESAIAASDGAALTLRLPPRHPVAPGTLVALIEGCDKRFETCRDRFANALNFRGEPHLPGIDLLTRYPGA